MSISSIIVAEWRLALQTDATVAFWRSVQEEEIASALPGVQEALDYDSTVPLQDCLQSAWTRHIQELDGAQDLVTELAPGVREALLGTSDLLKSDSEAAEIYDDVANTSDPDENLIIQAGDRALFIRRELLRRTCLKLHSVLFHHAVMLPPLQGGEFTPFETVARRQKNPTVELPGIGVKAIELVIRYWGRGERSEPATFDTNFSTLHKMLRMARMFGDYELEHRLLIHLKTMFDACKYASPDKLLGVIEELFTEPDVCVEDSGLHNKILQILAFVAIENQLKPGIEKGIRDSTELAMDEDFLAYYFGALSILVEEGVSQHQ